jgi:hypothetical protein
LKILVIAISVIVLVGSSLSCGQNDSQAAERHDLDRVVPRLPRGLSIKEVEERIGEPQRQYEAEGSGIVLTYGLWEVVFRPSLYMRIRTYPGGYWPADRPVAPLDRQVRSLELGISRQAVERELGKTEAWEIPTLGSSERIWYGNGRWKLHFVDRRLAEKVLYVGGSPQGSNP